MKKNVHILCFLVLFVGILSAQDSDVRAPLDFESHIISTESIKDMLTIDFNQDGYMDIISTGGILSWMGEEGQVHFYEQNPEDNSFPSIPSSIKSSASEKLPSPSTSND